LYNILLKIGLYEKDPSLPSGDLPLAGAVHGCQGMWVIKWSKFGISF